MPSRGVYHNGTQTAERMPVERMLSCERNAASSSTFGRMTARVSSMTFRAMDRLTLVIGAPA